MEIQQQSEYRAVQKQPLKKRFINGALFKTSFALLFMVPALLFWLTVIIVVLGVVVLSVEDEDECNVARIPVQGIITTTDNGLSEIFGFGAIASADSIVDRIQQAEQNNDISAIVVDIDSPGGTPVGGDEIMKALLATSKPTVTIMRDRGTSAAYWVAAGTDYIVASPVSDVGSIGVTMSYLEFASSSDYQGSRWIDISSGEYKDAGHPERVLSEKEREHFQGQVDVVHEYMVDQISSARDGLSRDRLAELADGRAYLGAEALKLGLVDELGGFNEVEQYLDNVLLLGEPVVMCPVSFGGLEDLLY